MRVNENSELAEKMSNNISQRNYSEDEVMFEDVTVKKNANEFDPAVLGQNISLLNSSWEIRYGDLYGNPISRFFKRVVRKLTRFIIIPLFEQQNNINGNIARSLSEVNKYVNDAPKYVMEQLNDQHSINVEAVKVQDQLIESLENKIALLEARIEALENGTKDEQ